MKSNNQQHENSTIVILSSRLAGWLMFNRFHLIDMRIDLKDSQRNVFIFKDSSELQDCISKYAIHKNMI